MLLNLRYSFFYTIFHKLNNKIIILFVIFLSFQGIKAQQIAILKYQGGGDWYANPTALPNLIKFSNENIHTKMDDKPLTVSVSSYEIFNFPIVFLTGHGNIFFSEEDSNNLRSYLISGGFLHVSDNYGLDKYIRSAMKNVFPKLDFQEIPNNHPIYHQKFDFDAIPKIHEHKNKKAQGFGLFYEGRLICFYDYESDLSDGWENESVHNDPLEIRLKALKMGSNIISYVFTN